MENRVKVTEEISFICKAAWANGDARPATQLPVTLGVTMLPVTLRVTMLPVTLRVTMLE